MRKYFYVIGIFLMIIGGISTVIVDALGIVLMLIATILIFFSSQKFWVKLLMVVLLPPLVIYGTLLCLMACFELYFQF